MAMIRPHRLAFILAAAVAPLFAGTGPYAPIGTIVANEPPGTAPQFKDIDIAGDILVWAARTATVDGVSDAGAVSIYQRDLGGPNAWGLAKRLTDPNPAFGQLFGASARIQGDQVFVAVGELNGAAHGRLMVYGRDQGGPDNWGLVQSVSDTGTAGCSYGRSLSVAGDVVAIGAACDGGQAGNVYVHERNAGGSEGWGLTAVLTAFDAAAWDVFGYSVAVGDGVIAVGAPGREPTGNQSDDYGAVYLFEPAAALLGGGWVYDQILTQSATAGSSMGLTVSLHGETLLATRGAQIMVFRRDFGGPGVWGWLQVLAAPSGPSLGHFALDGPIAIANGAPGVFVYDIVDDQFFDDTVATLPHGGGLEYVLWPIVDGTLAAFSVAESGGPPNQAKVYVFEALATDLVVGVDDGQPAASPGEQLVYLATVSNIGPNASPDTRLEVRMGEDAFDLSELSWTCTPNGSGASCSQGSGNWNDLSKVGVSLDLDPATSVELAITVEVAAAPQAPIACWVAARPETAVVVDTSFADNQDRDIDALSGTDFGDAPASYDTALEADGARHRIGGFALGAAVDEEPDGLPTSEANGDDLSGVDDEDGIQLGVLAVGLEGSLVATLTMGKVVTGTPLLDAWVDWDASGFWSSSEHVLVAEPLVPGANPLTISVPPEAIPGPTYARFRVSLAGSVDSYGPADDGEVEDYRLVIALFADGFEAGDTTLWSTTVP